jgi:hypothetical protein
VVDPTRARHAGGSWNALQQLLTPEAEQVAHRHLHSAAGEHRVYLAFHIRAQRH